MNRHIRMLLLFLASLLFGCKKFVEIDTPKTLLISTNIFENDESANSALTSIYTSMMNQNLNSSFSISEFTGFQGDELKNNASILTGQQLYSNSKLNPTDAPTNPLWGLGFNLIYRANGVIEGASSSAKLNPKVKKQIIAEAYFIRAFWNFYLFNLYGDIPIILSTDYTLNNKAPRAEKNVVFTQIIGDLKKAQNNLAAEYVGPNSVEIVNDRVRPNSFTATALLSRVYLFNQEYSNAENEADKLIDNSSLYHLEAFDNVFATVSKEAIWQLMLPMPNSSNINTYEGAFYILTSKPVSYSLANSATISDQLLNAFELSDLRKTNWIGTFTDNTVTPTVDYHFPQKYKVKSSATITEYTTVFRLAEQYLIRAEARAQQGKLDGAISDIDMIRERAGLPLIKDTKPNISTSELSEVILKERQTELFTEWGHRWLDLKRTQTIDQVMSDVAPLKDGTWSPYKALWPIPQNDINNNPAMKQNPEYN